MCLNLTCLGHPINLKSAVWVPYFMLTDKSLGLTDLLKRYARSKFQYESLTYQCKLKLYKYTQTGGLELLT